MDQSDERLIDQLKDDLRKQGYATAFDAEKEAGSQTDAAPAADDESGELDFMKAVNAFRAAKRCGDPSKVAAAERALQDFVRNEMRANEGCES